MSEEPPADVTIERADSEETDALAELWVELADEQRRYGSHLCPEANRSAIHETILQHVMTDTALLARRDGDIVGFVTFDIEPERYRQDVTRGIIQNVYVHEGHRSEGIGRGLLSAAETALEKRDVDVVALQAMAENDRAIRFYRRHGYEPHRIELEKPINSDTLKSNDG